MAAAGTWEVFLGGSYKPYDDPAVQRALEAAYDLGNAKADVTVRGTVYEVTLQGAQLQQRQKNDPTRTRKVRRVAPPAAPSPSPPTAVPPRQPAPPPSNADDPTDDDEDDIVEVAPPPAAAKRKAPAAAAAPPAKKAAAAAPAAKKAPKTPAAAASSSAPLMGAATADVSLNNEAIARMCDELADVERVKGDNIRASSYKKAAAAVREHPVPITSGRQAKKDVKGIGEKIALKIDELLATGGLEKLERERENEQNNALKQLQRVSGIGFAKAQDLVKNGVTDLDALRQRQAAQPGTLTPEQQIGLRHVLDFERRIPRDEMAELAAHVAAAAAAFDPPLTATACGSFRRGAASSGDIDVLLTNARYTSSMAEPEWLPAFVGRLQASGFVTDAISKGKKKSALVCRLPPPSAAPPPPDVAAPAAAPAPAAAAVKLPTWQEVAARKEKKRPTTDLFSQMRGGGSAPASQEEAVAPAAAPAAASASTAAAAADDDDDEFAAGERLHRRLDLRLVPHDQYCFGTLYFTGSDTLNKRMRAKAQELGYKLNEYSLMKGDDALPAASEEDVFKHLGMEYLAPADRNI